MEQSLYFEWVKKFFPQLVLSLVEKVNGKTTPLTYMHKDFLVPSYSSDGRWVSVLADYERVSADVVSLSSELPVKSRESIERASGKLPKIGMKFELGEQEMKDIDALLRYQNPNISLVCQKIFNDVPRVITGIDESVEDMFLTGLSTGCAIKPRNEGTGVRVDYGYKEENKFGVETEWAANAETSKPIDDINRVVEKATLQDGNTPLHLFADDAFLNAFYKSKQAREQYAFDMDFVGSNIPTLDFQKAASVILKRWGITLHRVARSIKTEINGVRKVHKPWKTGVGVFACNDKVGSLVWTDVAEASRPVNGVTYQTADEYILVSKYSKSDPLREYTAAQAMVVPIIDNVDSIYTIDTTQVQG